MSARVVGVDVLTGGMIVVFWATTGAGATATGSTGATLAAGVGATATPGAAQRGGARSGAGAIKLAPGTVKTAAVFLVLLLRGMMKICLWFLVSVLLSRLTRGGTQR